MSQLYKVVNGFDAMSGAAFGGGGGGAVLPPSIRHTQYTNPHATLPGRQGPTRYSETPITLAGVVMTTALVGSVVIPMTFIPQVAFATVGFVAGEMRD